MHNKVWSIRVNSLAPAEKEKEEEKKKILQRNWVKQEAKEGEGKERKEHEDEEWCDRKPGLKVAYKGGNM